jgi:hypothetical protein
VNYWAFLRRLPKKGRKAAARAARADRCAFCTASAPAPAVGIMQGDGMAGDGECESCPCQFVAASSARLDGDDQQSQVSLNNCSAGNRAWNCCTRDSSGTKRGADFYLYAPENRERNGTMKRILLALSAVAALAVSAGAASAQDIRVGPGGIHVGPGHRYYDSDRCRTIIDHRINADGDRVTVRRRICD